MAILKTLLIIALSVPVVTLAGALALIVSQPPSPAPRARPRAATAAGWPLAG